MRVVILGGAGFLGKRLAVELLRQDVLTLNGRPNQNISSLVIFDQVKATGLPADPRLQVLEGDISNKNDLRTVLGSSTDLIFHLAAVVSGEAEKNFELGMQVNLQATLLVLEYCRAMPMVPVLVFTSSCAVFGGDTRGIVTDNTAPVPQSSYGTQKALAELLINDYSRRNFLDGRALRLPTIAIRPGVANAATSSFVSAIIREPLMGKPTNCPVDAETKLWILSPKRIIAHFLRAAQLPAQDLAENRIINLPGITVSVGDMVKCLEEVASQSTVDLISWEPDAFIQSIVLTWPPNFETSRSAQLGFQPDQSIKEIVLSFIEEELS